MIDKRILFSSKATELSETDTYIELSNCLCYYDAPNANGVELPSDDASERAETLVNMPVVARYRVNAKGEPDLGGHECYVDPVTQEVQFRTENIGTHIAVEVKDSDVVVNGESKVLPCLFATSRIWKRNKNVVAAIKRLFDDGMLFSSWEIASYAYTFENGIKRLTDYVFEANCLLGTGHVPAYGSTAHTISIASEDPETMIASALVEDVLEREGLMKKNKNLSDEQPQEIVQKESEVDSVDVAATPEASSVVEEQSGHEEIQQPENEVSALTVSDIYEKLTRACREYLKNYCYIFYLFPEEHIAWVIDCEDPDRVDTEFISFSYEVIGDEVVIVGEPQKIRLSVSVSEINSAIAERDSAIVDANARINELQSQVDALEPYRKAHEEAEAARIEKEKAEKKSSLTKMLECSGLFTDEDMASEEISSAIDNLDSDYVNRIIAEKFISGLQAEKKDAGETPRASTEVAAVISDDSEGNVSYRTFMNVLLNK